MYRTWWLCIAIVLLGSVFNVALGNDDYYAAGDDNYNNNNNNNYNNNNYNYNNNDDANNNGNNGDDAYVAGDDAAAADDAAAQEDDNYNDDYYANGDDANDQQEDDAVNNYANYVDDWAQNQGVNDDDLFHWNTNVGFEGVSIMPVSCINYNNGHMIKFSFFESENSYQCHFAEIGTFVVSIAHYMRAYFNYQALVNGKEFSLPGDAGYLNCVLLQETTYSSQQLYAKIGCMERETFTSTKLALHLYTDAECSQPYDDGESSRRHSTKGYEINGYTFSTHVSFRPPFYTCATCAPETISDSFNKRAGTWYDDDYISEHGTAQEQDADGNDDGQGYYVDDYADDTYLSANDDINNYGNGDDFYNARNLMEVALRGGEPEARPVTAAEGQLEAFENDFWSEVENQRRSLYDNMYNINDWNMCQRVYKYGLWCDEDCKSLDAFRTDRWSGADIILLSIMVTFLTGMMLLIVAKRLKAAQKSRMYQEDVSMPGLPPVAMFGIFVAIMTIIVTMAKLKFVNETLVFAVVTCVLLFIYMLKLTLFDNRRPVLLAAPRHEIFDNPMDERLFD